MLWDWDGTLADTVPLVTRATALVLERNGFAAVDETGVHLGMRYPTVRRMAFHSGLDLAEEGARRTAERLAEEFYAVSASPEAGNVALFEGVDAMLRALAEAGIRLGVVSNNHGTVVRRHARGAGLGRLFPCIVAEEDVSHPKPDPEGIRRALDELGATPDESVYVGDSASDAEAGRAAGVTTIAAGWARVDGAQSPGPEFDLTVGSPAELVRIIVPRISS
ncbi:MAG: HAD family hydrolase [Spirochaetota bacterium]